MEGAATRRIFIGGNWKSNNTVQQTKDLVQNTINKLSFDSARVEVLVAPVFIQLQWAKENVSSNVYVGAQNVSLFGFGAYTGEISAEALKDIGVEWTIIGHSERRTLFGETDEVVLKKTTRALEQGLKVIFCFGEVLAEREANQTIDVVNRQISGLKSLKPEHWNNIVLAYEPVWAIGTGKVATPEQAQEVHQHVRKWISSEISAEVAQNLRIIYGGSVNEKNCGDLIKQGDVDGFLVGGASLKPEFAKIVETCNTHNVSA
eukprot:TRINITY_DN2761_c0_g1_i6.p1 TRINITY_DN2761_c0_g1~~TRINITY_DN2761_c0_g1_i6.p1  ORF type:complete len:261 (-),score=95.62 TRINITY_DN2761_c0_g1_i6:811-1593(-)